MRPRLRSLLIAALAGLGGLAVLAALAAPAHAIVGGTPAPPDRFPWMAAILDASTADAPWAQYCGGAVIGRRRVLTAAHCVLGRRSKEVEVLLGRTRLTLDGGRRIAVRAISVYPGHVSGREPSLDAAVITLAAKARVPPLALARPGREAAWEPGTRAWAMGWGAINARPSPGDHVYFADRLREIMLPVQGDDACESVFGIGFDDYPYRPEWVLCAGAGTGTEGTCVGDSGGPLVVPADGTWLGVGVLSGGDACAAPGYYDLFARVDAISGFALSHAPIAQPDPVSPPRVAGELTAGARVRCVPGGWRGDPARITVRWTRVGDPEGRVLGRGAGYRLTRGDARHGVRCAVTAVNRGGRNTIRSRGLAPA